MAVAAAKAKGIPTVEYLPRVDRWRDGYRPRNLKIARECDHLIRIVVANATTYGSGWTRDMVARMGKPWEEYVVE